jgi:AraC-like DNA-binding protein
MLPCAARYGFPIPVESCTYSGHRSAAVTGEKRQPRGYSFVATDYDIFQVIYVTDGRLRFHREGRESVLLPHQAVVLGPRSAFRLACPERGYEGICYVGPAAEGEPVKGLAAVVRADSALRQLAALLSRELGAGAATMPRLRESLGVALAWQAVRLAGGRAPLPAGPERNRRAWCELAGQALANTLYARRDPGEALRGLGLSYRQLARYLREEYGLSPKQYQTRLRLEEARRLLTTTELSVTSIAYELGFASSQHLAGRFRALTGETPSAYRRRAGAAAPPRRSSRSRAIAAS